jgi:hypothetical protein
MCDLVQHTVKADGAMLHISDCSVVEIHEHVYVGPVLKRRGHDPAGAVLECREPGGEWKEAPLPLVDGEALWLRPGTLLRIRPTDGPKAVNYAVTPETRNRAGAVVARERWV